MWLVSGDSNRVYLLGSVHLLRRDDHPLPGIFGTAYDDAEALYMEIDMVAGPKCFTPELQVDPGDILELQIAVNFNDTPGCTRR